jgi:hypothetical protein
VNRPALAALLALLLIAACQIHVTIWLFGHPVARPPVAGLVFVALCVACPVVWALALRSCRGFRSSPYLRTVRAAS